MKPHVSISDIATEEKLYFIKHHFLAALKDNLQLHPVFAPLFVPQHSGLNDDLNGIEVPVTFKSGYNEKAYAIVHSLAKWKRMRLSELSLSPYEGIVTHMLAIRPEEERSAVHSILVDQWDWEIVIRKADRTTDFLKRIVGKIYQAIRQTALALQQAYPQCKSDLPKEITFIHAEDLLQQFPGISAKEREHKIAQRYGAVFITGIGHPLSNGLPHDGRSADYDDWSTAPEDGYHGLNGDIILWHAPLQRSLEISSMGIRVDAQALMTQLQICGAEDRQKHDFHRGILEGTLPLSIGGGIGQSRLCMFLLQQQDIHAVQYSY